MSPKLREENYVQIVPERIKDLSKKRNITLTYLAEQCIFTTYRNFSKQLSTGRLKKQWVEILAEKLDCSRKYLTGEKTHPGHRVEDFYSVDMMKSGLKQLMKYYEMGHYVDMIDDLSDISIQNIADIIIALIDSPDDFYHLVDMEQIEEIHFRKVFGEE